MLEKMVAEVFNAIVRYHSENNMDAIPHSDFFYKQYIASHGIKRETLDKIIDILKASHKILSIEISRADEDHGIERVEGYVDADLTTIGRLRHYFQNALVDQYEEKHHKRLGIYQIIKEIFPRMNVLNNTPMGFLANKAIMLDEYEKLIKKHYLDYTEDWKARKLTKVLEEMEETINTEISDDKVDKNKQTSTQPAAFKRRAVDSNKYDDFSSASKQHSTEKVLSIFGTEFFFRVNLRKYKFDYIRETVEKQIINNKSDLSALKDMIKKVRKNAGKDTQLKDHMNELDKLERAIRLTNFRQR